MFGASVPHSVLIREPCVKREDTSHLNRLNEYNRPRSTWDDHPETEANRLGGSDMLSIVIYFPKSNL